MRIKNTIAALACAAAALALPAAATAAPKGPPAPKSANGKEVQLVATGVPVPTSFAFAGKRTFVAGAAEGPMKGGLFVVKGRKAVKVPGSPKSVFGLAYRDGTLYASAGRDLIAYSGYDGARFATAKKIYKGSKKFTGFSGLAFGPDGRLYAGVVLDQRFDHRKATSPYGQSVVSMEADGSDIKVVSKGLRQPWMMTFADGEASPFVSVLGQDLPKNNGAPDMIVEATPDSDFGFPGCNWANPGACAGFDDPLAVLPAVEKPKPHQMSPMGIGAIGDTLYVALFTGRTKGPEVVTMGTDGKGIKPFLTRYVAPVLSVGVSGGWVYTGDLSGSIYRVRAR